MSIALIAADMDGTLLDRDHMTVPTRNLDALRRASEGRTVLSVSHRIYENLGGRTVEIKIL